MGQVFNCVSTGAQCFLTVSVRRKLPTALRENTIDCMLFLKRGYRVERHLEAKLTQLNGKLKARLEAGTKSPSKEEELIDLINRRIHPPRPVKNGEVHIRAMYIVSDSVNNCGGRFPPEEHDRIAALLVDTPVMVGHSKEKLPVARNFHAVVERANSSPKGEVTSWVKVYFYWAKGTKEGEDLKTNIDSGIYKECSISFSFTTPECSICGEDIRECKHIPFRKYRGPSGELQTAYFNYRGVEKILETSLVYRGATPNTRITKELEFFSLQGYLGQKPPGQVPKEEDKRFRFSFSVNGNRYQFVLPSGYEKRIKQGRCFLADSCYTSVRPEEKDGEASLEDVTIPPGEIVPTRLHRDLMEIRFLSPQISGDFRFRKVIINEKFRWLFYRMKSQDEE